MFIITFNTFCINIIKCEICNIYTHMYTHTFMHVYIHASCLQVSISEDNIHSHPVLALCVSACVYLVKLLVNDKNSEHDQELPQSQTAEKPMALRRNATQQSQDIRQTPMQSSQFSLSHQDDYKTRMDIK